MLWRDVDFDGGYLRIRQQLGRDGLAPLKSKNSKRDVVLAPQLSSALRKHYLRSSNKAPDGLAFTGTGGFSAYFDRLTKRLNLNGEKNLRRHDLRHTWGSILVASGCDVAHVARQLGDTVETVMRVYVHEWEKASHA